MAMIISRPASILVQSPTVPASSFGNGADAGSYAADVWKPGRDSQGRVNAASWALLPSGRWSSVQGTRLDSLDSVVKTAVPGWRDFGDWSGVLQGWSGFAIDQVHSRLWIMGGGHSDSSNNGLYRFDAFKMAWAVEKMPSDPTPWSTAYKTSGSFSGCPESAAASTARNTAGTLKAVNDIYYDELLWDQQPTARHTYSSMVYAPESNELVMVCRRLWRYSLTERRWTYKRLIRDQFAMWMDGENVVGVYDESTREVLTSSSGSNSFNRSTGYSLTNNAWTDWSAPWARFGGVADTRHGRFVTAVLPPERAVGSYASPGRYWKYNLDTRALDASGDLQFAGGLVREDFPADNWYYDGSGLTYVPSINRYWLLTKMGTGAMKFVQIDPTTTPWTASPLNGMAGAVPTVASNIKRKLVHLPGMNAVVLVDTANKDASIYKI